MTAFKIGDKVKVIDKTWVDEDGQNTFGRILTVIADDDSTYRYIDYQKGTVEIAMLGNVPSSFELVTRTTFKVGDRVRLLEYYDLYEEGSEGIVTSVSDTFSNAAAKQLVYVEFGKGRGYPCGVFDIRLELIESQKPVGILQMIETTSKKVGTGDTQAILLSLMEEVGELATEINIENGTKKRSPSVDGVEGEAIDVLIVVCDLLTSLFGSLESEELRTRVAGKLAKWERNV